MKTQFEEIKDAVCSNTSGLTIKQIAELVQINDKEKFYAKLKEFVKENKIPKRGISKWFNFKIT